MPLKSAPPPSTCDGRDHCGHVSQRDSERKDSKVERQWGGRWRACRNGTEWCCSKRHRKDERTLAIAVITDTSEPLAWPDCSLRNRNGI